MLTLYFKRSIGRINKSAITFAIYRSHLYANVHLPTAIAFSCVCRRSFCSSNLRHNVSNKATITPTKAKEESQTNESNDSSVTAAIVPSTKVWTIPNLLTFSRIGAAPLLTYFICYDMKTAALCGCLAAGFTDWLDGYIAKNYDMSSLLGEVVDPIADKVVIGCLAAGLAIKGLFPVSLMALIILRDVTLLGGATYLRYCEKPVGAPMFDPSSFTFQVKPSLLSKVNTALQFSTLAATLYAWGVLDEGSVARTLLVDTYMPPLWIATGATTVLSGVGYLDGSGIAAIQRRVDDARAVKADVQAAVHAHASDVQAEVQARAHRIQSRAELVQNKVQTKVRRVSAKALDIAGIDIVVPGRSLNEELEVDIEEPIGDGGRQVIEVTSRSVLVPGPVAFPTEEELQSKSK